ncbi:MAG: RNA polymerase sigma factor [Pyrinomonadaceae bacterium]
MPDEQIDERLLRLARRGDEAAFLSLYERHHAPVFRFACRLLGDAATAEDVLHDCFLDLVRPADGAADYDASRGSLRNYLYGMARHRALKFFRRTARECELDDAAGEAGAVESRVESQTPLAHLLDAELGEIVRRAIQALPPLQRESLVLFEYEELSLAEIAEIVGVDINTVKARLFRARRTLRKTLAPHSSPYGVEALTLKD